MTEPNKHRYPLPAQPDVRPPPLSSNSNYGHWALRFVGQQHLKNTTTTNDSRLCALPDTHQKNDPGMIPSIVQQMLDAGVSSAKAAISVILVLFYGFLVRRWGLISQQGESSMSKLGTTLLLPCLLFSEIGPLATADKLVKYWPIIPISLFFQLLSLSVALLLRAGGMQEIFVPMFVFNNVTSLPLLLLKSLSKNGSLDALLRHGESRSEGTQRGEVYLLINALVGNLTRFALGPFLMKTHKHFTWSMPHIEDPASEALEMEREFEGAIRLPDVDGHDGQPATKTERALSTARTIGARFTRVLNPPLIGGILAVICGVIPFLHHWLFDNSGWLSPFADSISNVGDLFTALQMFVLGAHLYSRKSSHASVWVLAMLFTWRFLLLPAISISSIYGIRTKWPNLIIDDPMMDFALMMSNVGPPAITLAAIADLAELPDEVEGQVARIITISYGVTPLIALPVTAALTVIQRSRSSK